MNSFENIQSHTAYGAIIALVKLNNANEPVSYTMSERSERMIKKSELYSKMF